MQSHLISRLQDRVHLPLVHLLRRRWQRWNPVTRDVSEDTRVSVRLRSQFHLREREKAPTAGQIVIKITVKEVPVEPEEPDTKVTLTKDNTVIEVADVTYTGKAQKPEVTVTVDGKKLEAADHTASYANNVNAGTAKVTITGKNDYTGSVEQTFKINKADQTVTGNTLYVYNRYITVKAAGKGTVTYSSTNKNIADSKQQVRSCENQEAGQSTDKDHCLRQQQLQQGKRNRNADSYPCKVINNKACIKQQQKS